MYNVCFQHFSKLYQPACSSSNCLVRTVFQSVSLFCHNFIRHNLMFGKSFVRDYSSLPSDSVNSVRELRDNLLFVPGFQTSELNLLCVYIIVRYLLSLLYSILCGVNNNNNTVRHQLASYTRHKMR